ncbi:MAG: hypothetical protein QOE55_1134 [Acidobacteriaceae bacterium]|nr:hypothetical protein [Acidobacteriaceae bacterium]
MLTSAASSNFESEEMPVFCFACHKCHGHPASDHQRRPPRNKPFSSAIRNCVLKASVETGLTRAACALHRGHSPDLSSFWPLRIAMPHLEIWATNRIKCRPSIMTHRVAENETSHSVSAVSPTGKPNPRKYRSEADWPGVETRNTAWQGPREKLRHFHGYDLPEGSLPLPCGRPENRVRRHLAGECTPQIG